ncbi:hypothetical protein EDB86DRAFT_2901277, partial [Lactarius hatsudake]
MGDILDSGVPLKPVILGLLHPRTPDGPKTVWGDVAVIIKVKDHSAKTVKQLATYAPNHLSLNRRLSFSITIAFDHRALTLRFLCFHRSGVSASELLTLEEEDGFRSVVEHMVGILSIRDEAGFGLDSTRVKEVFHLNGRYYDIVRTIKNRDSICGRATAVYSLKLQTTDTPGIPEWPSPELTLIDEVPQIRCINYHIRPRITSGRHLTLSFLWPFRDRRHHWTPCLCRGGIIRFNSTSPL